MCAMPDNSPSDALLFPEDLIDRMNRTVHGQGDAKKVLTSSAYAHFLNGAARDAGVPLLGPQHVLLLGPTGTGKSCMVRTLADILDVPFTYVNAATLSQTGYVGNQLEDMVRLHYRRAGQDLEQAHRGIIFIDEIDKIRSQPSGHGPDVSGEGVQTELLSLLDGTEVTITPPGKEGPAGAIDTSRILFVCAGAFVGLDRIVAGRLGDGVESLGFQQRRCDNSAAVSPLRHVQSQDLMSFGLIPELVGRLPGLAVLEPLDEDDLVDIMILKKDSVLTHKVQFWKLHGIELRFTDEALEAVAREALALGTGARALENILKQVLAPLDAQPRTLMEKGIRSIVIHPDCVLKQAPAQFITGTEPVTSEELDDLRLRAVTLDEEDPGSGRRVAARARLSHGQARRELQRVKKRLGWEEPQDWNDDNVSSDVKWWRDFEKENQDNPGLVLRLAQELDERRATIREFYLAYVYSNVDNIQANLHYLDYLRLKRKEEEQKRRERARQAQEKAAREAEQEAEPTLCPHCDNRVEAEDIWCTLCGHRLDS